MKGTGQFITMKECKELEKLYVAAQNTPVILVGGVDMAEQAWDRVRNLYQQLAAKYDIDLKNSGIDPQTGEIMIKND